jgi:hypothetical protein
MEAIDPLTRPQAPPIQHPGNIALVKKYHEQLKWGGTN